MEIDDIESKIACGELTAAQVFTQMKQHINECKCTAPLIEKSGSGANVPIDRLVMRQLLTKEIKSLDRNIERLEKSDNLDAAAHVSAKREGVCWAMFVLNVRLGG